MTSPKNDSLLQSCKELVAVFLLSGLHLWGKTYTHSIVNKPPKGIDKLTCLDLEQSYF